MTVNPLALTTGYGVGVSSGYRNNGVSNSIPAGDISGMLLGGISSTGTVGAVGGQPVGQVARTADGSTFADLLTGSIGRLQGLQSTADGYAKQAATGDLQDVHDYMIAASEAKLATTAVVTLKNKAVEAFNDIMRMPV
ncbi:flagellar hook-basal body complex protein FliE [Klenkia sp. LSe6-5]|uniref:Flagellar hook-basal body complex protein FliE n=1 Tax=Klenkia sesuvii TaxID=3103137 RepID=A0ABU8DPW1_9ACTN